MRTAAPAADNTGTRLLAIVSAMRRPATICLPLLMLAACSGSDDSSTAATAAPTAATTPSTPVTAGTTPDPTATTTPPTTTPPPITAPPATTTPPTATPTTAQTPTTEPTGTTLDPTIDEAVQLQLAVIARVEASWPNVRAVYEDPYNDELLARLDDFYTGSLLEGFRNVVQQLRDGNFRTVERDGDPEVYRAEPRSLTVDLDAGRASVQVCHVNTSTVVETAGNPDGSDRFVADDYAEQVVLLDVRLIDGVWKLASAREPDVAIATCP